MGHFVIAVSGVNDSPPGPQKLMLFDFSTRKWKVSYETTMSGFNYPSFSRDGRYVYFSDPEAATFYRLRMGSNKLDAIAKIDAPGGMKTDDFWFWSGLAPDDSPMFLRDSSAREVYALDVNFP